MIINLLSHFHFLFPRNNLIIKEPFQLTKRTWKIHSNGTTETMIGRGVVGQHPLLTPDEPIFKYTSQVKRRFRSRNDHAVMWGLYDFQSEEDGRSIQGTDVLTNQSPVCSRPIKFEKNVDKVTIPKFDLIPHASNMS